MPKTPETANNQRDEAVATWDRGGKITCPRYVIFRGERHEASFM